jgi:hypothetical protein
VALGGRVQRLPAEHLLLGLRLVADQQLEVLVETGEVLIVVEGHSVLDLAALQGHLFAAATPDQHIFQIQTVYMH